MLPQEDMALRNVYGPSQCPPSKSRTFRVTAALSMGDPSAGPTLCPADCPMKVDHLKATETSRKSAVSFLASEPNATTCDGGVAKTASFGPLASGPEAHSEGAHGQDRCGGWQGPRLNRSSETKTGPAGLINIPFGPNDHG